MSERHVDVWEVSTEDGGVGVRVGDGPVHMGIGADDVERLLSVLFDGIEWPDSACEGGTLHAGDEELEYACMPYLAGGRAYAQRVAVIRERTEWLWE